MDSMTKIKGEETVKVIDIRPPKLAQALILLAVTGHYLFPKIVIYSNIWLGVFIGATGFIIMMIAWWQFKQTNSPICPQADTQFIITSGIYSYSRNPMYLGMIMILLAVALVVGSFPFYFITVLFFIIINFVFCTFEEEKLKEKIGVSYLLYCEKVGRWI